MGNRGRRATDGEVMKLWGAVGMVPCHCTRYVLEVGTLGTSMSGAR